MEFDLRVSKIAKEQDERRKLAAKTREQELRKQNETIRLRQQLEEASRRAKEEERIKFEAAEAKRLEEEAANGGVVFERTLSVYETDGEDDKIILDEKSLTILNEKNAFGLGPLLFKISVSGQPGVFTHCGVREFRAAEGSVGLPSTVITRLSNGGKVAVTEVTVKYCRLPKITNVTFQPYNNLFFEVAAAKSTLEDNLRFHSTLTVGDVLTIWHRGKAFLLRVSDIKPEPAGTLIDCDIEVQFESMGTATTSSQNSEAASMTSNLSSDQADQLDQIYKPTQDSTSCSSKSKPEIATISESLPELPPEPASDLDPQIVVHIKIRIPQGSTISRRFLRTEPAEHLFTLASAAMKISRRSLQLSTRFPPRTLTFDSIVSSYDNSVDVSKTSLNTLGLGKQELFLADIIPQTGN